MRKASFMMKYWKVIQDDMHEEGVNISVSASTVRHVLWPDSSRSQDFIVLQQRDGNRPGQTLRAFQTTQQ